MFSQVVDISPYLVRDFIMKEAQTQEEVSTFSEHFVAGNVVPSFPAPKLDVLWVNADCSPVEPVLSQVIALISRRQRRTEFTHKL